MKSRYLPDISLPPNVLAVPDVKVAAENADVLVWVLPHQFGGRTASSIKDVLPGQPQPAGGAAHELVREHPDEDVRVLRRDLHVRDSQHVRRQRDARQVPAAMDPRISNPRRCKDPTIRPSKL